MRFSVRLLALSMIVALAPMAQAGGMNDVKDEPDVMVADDNDDQGGGMSLGSLGNSGALVAGGILALALIAAASGGSGSH